MNTDQLKTFIGTFWDDQILPSLTEYIRIPNKSPAFDPEVGGERLHGAGGHADDRLGAAACGGVRRRDDGGGAAAGAHAADLHRDPGRRQRRHRPALWPSRQAAGDEGLGRGHGAVDPGAQGRQALRPRRRRRRLRDLCLLRRVASTAGAEGAARPLRHHDRGLRGIRQLRPALLCRPSARPHRRPVAGRLPRFRLRRLGPHVAHHVAARHRRRHAQGARAERRRPFGRRLGDRALLVPHRAQPADAAGGRGDGRDEAARPLRADPAAAHQAGRGGRPRAG